MNDQLMPYPIMKNSGVPGLGDIPAHWELKRAKTYFREVDVRSTTGEEELLSVSHKTGVTPRSQKSVTMFLAESNVGHKLAGPGDVVVNTMWAWMAALGVSRYHGIVSPSYAVYRRRGNVYEDQYLDELLRLPIYRDHYKSRSTGITDSRLRLYPEIFLRMPFLAPPREEQAAIIRFVNHSDRKIRHYIGAKQKLINLLDELVTTRAAEAIRHPSCQTERLATVATQELRPVIRDDAQTYVALGLYNRGRGIFHKPPVSGADLGDSTFSWVMPGDLVISGQFAWEGAVAIASENESSTVVSHRYYVLRGVEGRATTHYLWALLRSDFGSMLLDQHSRGAAGRNRPLNFGRLLKERVPIPRLETQLALSQLIESIAPIRMQVASDIALLREYRTRLVTDVVSGKVDVREAAAKLPDLPAEREPLDEIDDLPQDEESAEMGELGAEDAA